MTDHQLHLQQLKEQQTQLTEDIQKLSMAATEKRDLLLKVQGAIEYIQQISSSQSQSQSLPVFENSEEE